MQIWVHNGDLSVHHVLSSLNDIFSSLPVGQACLTSNICGAMLCGRYLPMDCIIKNIFIDTWTAVKNVY
jgi:hypothetical protein